MNMRTARDGWADAHALSLRSIPATWVRGAPLCERFWPEADRAGGLLDGRQPGAQTGRGVGAARPPLLAVAAFVRHRPGSRRRCACMSRFTRAYEWRFLLGLKARYARKAELFPSMYATPRRSGRCGLSVNSTAGCGPVLEFSRCRRPLLTGLPAPALWTGLHGCPL